jgi:C-terminal processing protease CtpA/Prc
MCSRAADDKAWMAGGSVETSSTGGRGEMVLCGVGLGLADHWDNTGARVSDILPYSPAAEARVFNKGDRIVSIDSVDVRGKKVPCPTWLVCTCQR